MIRIGLTDEQKMFEIKNYVENNEIKNVIIFSPEKMYMNLTELNIPIRQIEYKEIEMYRTFYPLLEEIDNNYLLVANELMRDRNRNCLIYNCYAKYTNQTKHRIVFNYFPIIECKRDIMTLIDFDNSQQCKGFGLNDIDIGEYDIQCVRKKIELNIIKVPLPNGAADEYEAEKKRLFDELGNKDPDTIPRSLHLWTGRYKKSFLDSSTNYVARNSRFKAKNITVYNKVLPKEKYVLLDMPWRRLWFNDFLWVTRQEKLQYLSTGFGVDDVYINALRDWIKEVEAIYAQTGIYKEKC